ncbi:MFS transporter [Pseudarthrobacter psychrotolerans]|uniref:MFS transporter n=1 Tax=Pseudarthrobacter psychrotolerans TaxID=2697569 RepID=A0A6P1NJ19_9MICC|nr:MFS transporter [Pseudarthrobacter psychrotolerans]QHK19083.1 MFS transporter [Pseudarthrobacter psychrotolerans]
MARILMTERGVRQVQRRTVVLLSAAQVFGGIGTGATVSIGSILAVELSGSSVWAGAVATVMTLGAALTALPLASLAERRGRRAGQVTGLSAALAGTVLIVLSVVSGLFVLLVLGAVGIGVGTAASLQARFAAVDLADAEHRGRALSAVVWAVTVGAVAGPNLIQPGTVVGQALGLPPVAGPFVISAAGLLLAIVLLFAGLRPDPLLLAREIAAQETAAQPAGGKTQGTPPTPANQQGTNARNAGGGSLARGLRAIRQSRASWLALAAVVGAHAVMVGVMSMTPLHLQELVAGPGSTHAGHAASGDVLVIIGFTISLHIAGMFALSPVMGWLTDKAGRTETIMIGFATLIAAVVVAGFGQTSTVAVAVGLVLLGMGWSAATISGSTLLAESVPQESRVVVQGVSDMLMGAAGAVGGATSGLILSWAGYLGLNMAGGLVGAGVLTAAVIVLVARRRSPAAGSATGSAAR